MPATITDRLDGLTTSVAVKPPCVAVASSNITLAGLQTISGVTLEAADRVLVIGQTDDTENGIYTADSGDWTRARDFDGDRDAVQGTLVLVRNQFTEGAFYELTTANPVTFGTSSITFRLRDAPNVFFDLNQAEIDNSITPLRYTFTWGDVRRYCSATETNHQQAFINADLASAVIYAPEGTWNVDYFVMSTAGRRLKTDGFGTVIKQRAGNIARRIIEVKASHITIEDLTVEGQIAVDTGEQQHGIIVFTDAAAIQNINIGNVQGKNLRGDVVIIAGRNAGREVYGVTIGQITADNVLRNGLSITGGVGIRCASVVPGPTLGVGYLVFDVEPNPDSQVCDDIYIGYSRGRQCGVAGQASLPVGHVEIAAMEFDPAFQVNSTPGYGFFLANKFQAFVIRNYKSIKVGRFKCDNHDYAMIRQPTNVGDYVSDSLEIGYIEGSNNSLTDPTYDYYIVGGGTYLKKFRVRAGYITLQSNVKRAFGLLEYPIAENVTCNGTIFSECTAPVLRNCIVDSTYAAYVVRHTVNTAPGATFDGCRVTFTGAVGALSAHKQNTVKDSTVVVGNFLFPSGSMQNTIINSTLNTVYTANGVHQGSGNFTMSAAATKGVANTSITAATKVTLIPRNAAAATLMQGTKSLYISAITADTSFTVATADGTNAAGTESFDYVLTQ